MHLKMIEKQFSHVKNIPIYMQKVCDYLATIPTGQMLDVPAGNGHVVNYARKLGFEAVGGDINGELIDFVHCNMEQEFPFPSGHFDVVTCLEGIEHVVQQDSLLTQLVRVTKPGGTIILSTPNINNFYSRIKFLLTGTFGQFEPHQMRAKTDAAVDLGHIHPISPQFLSYLMHVRGAELQWVKTDRLKRLAYAPLYLVLWPLMYLCTARMLRQLKSQSQAYLPESGYKSMLLGWQFMWSRSAILIFKKTGSLS
jgi:SAM-dependent methyltransferase